MPFTMLAKGYTISGDVRSGMRVTVPYIGPWSEAIAFINGVLPSPTASGTGSISWTQPAQLNYQFGTNVSTVYAQSYTCVPCGANGLPVTSGGLAPGDYFSTALVTVEYSTVNSIQQTSDDPQGQNQLDPTNPITLCEQSVKITGKVTTRKGSGYTYDTTGKPCPGDLIIITNEVRLVFTFPRIPFIAWQLVQPYIGKINTVAMMNCAIGSLLLEGMDTVITPTPDGSIAQKIALMFAFNPDWTGANPQGISWNTFPLPDGSGYSLVTSVAGGARPYPVKDHRTIFNSLQF